MEANIRRFLKLKENGRANCCEGQNNGHLVDHFHSSGASQETTSPHCKARFCALEGRA